ncbi:hypothetical protein FBY03_115100 [Pseudomonas sp. SJZ079]|nr:hypothetical protein FBY03_115100 [Pseudomonas sp. SJZ079]
MSGHLGLREDARVGARLALRIARLFPRQREQSQSAHSPAAGLSAALNPAAGC